MDSTQQSLLDFFRRIALRDTVQIESIRKHVGFTLKDNQWLFRLSALHHYLQQLSPPGYVVIDYPSFRKLLYGIPINENIRPLGAEIIIADNQGRVDYSTYALVWKVPYRCCTENLRWRGI